jgi:glycosyltransferase involved in cell wall biosynthesis
VLRLADTRAAVTCLATSSPFRGGLEGDTPQDGFVRVAFHFRRQAPSRFSIERVFDTVGRNLPSPFTAVPRFCPYVGRGIVDRFRNGLAARQAREPMHHVTGDVHYVACFLPRGRTVLTVHDCSTLEYLSGARRAIARLVWYWLPVRCASIVTTISEFSRQQLLQVTGCRPDKVSVVYDPVPPGFAPAPRPEKRRRPIVLQVGAAPNKNVTRVAEAIAPLGCALWIVGQPNGATASVIAGLGLDHTVFSNVHDEELVELYRQCDVAIVASTYEGFGLPVVEAQASARPVVTSNICSMPEVAGDGACLVDPYDAESIRSGVKRVLSDEGFYERLVERGLRNVARFAPERIGAQYANLYRQLLARGDS